MEEIGRRLRAAREEKGLSLQTAEDETRIRRKYLEALENNREADLPGEAYLKGFLRTYGNFLGLDGPAMVEEYKAKRAVAAGDPAVAHGHRTAPEEQHGRETAAMAVQRPEPLPKPAAHRPELPAAAPAPRPVASPAKSVPPVRREAGTSLPLAAAAERLAAVGRPRRRSGGWIYSRQAGWTLLALIAVVALWFGGTRVMALLKAPNAAPPVATPKTPAPATTPNTPPPPAPTPTPQPEPAKVVMNKGTGEKANEVTFTVPGKEIQLRVEPSTDRVWYEATVDGKIAFSETTTAAHDFKGGAIKLHMGHMDGVSLVINGQRFDKPLADGPWWLVFNSK